MIWHDFSAIRNYQYQTTACPICTIPLSFFNQYCTGANLSDVTLAFGPLGATNLLPANDNDMMPTWGSNWQGKLFAKGASVGSLGATN